MTRIHTLKEIFQYSKTLNFCRSEGVRSEKASLRENPVLSIIAAIAENNVIGRNNQLLWHLPNDLKRFKRLTTGHKIIMGRNTFMSLPKGALPHRTNIVLTKNKNFNPANCVMAFSIREVFDKCDKNKENFVIGGGIIYDQFIKYAAKLYLTKVYGSFEGDAYFPEVDLSEWELTEQENFTTDEKHKHSYSFLVYKRIN